MHNYNYNYIRLKLFFVGPKMPEARSNKTGFDIMIVHFYIRRKLDIIRYDTGGHRAVYYNNPQCIIRMLSYSLT